MKDKKFFWKSSLSECFFDSKAIQYNSSTPLPKLISRNLCLEKVSIINENKNKGKFKFSVLHVY